MNFKSYLEYLILKVNKTSQTKETIDLTQNLINGFVPHLTKDAEALANLDNAPILQAADNLLAHLNQQAQVPVDLLQSATLLRDVALHIKEGGTLDTVFETAEMNRARLPLEQKSVEDYLDEQLRECFKSDMSREDEAQLGNLLGQLNTLGMDTVVSGEKKRELLGLCEGLDGSAELVRFLSGIREGQTLRDGYNSFITLSKGVELPAEIGGEKPELPEERNDNTMKEYFRKVMLSQVDKALFSGLLQEEADQLVQLLNSNIEQEANGLVMVSNDNELESGLYTQEEIDLGKEIYGYVTGLNDNLNEDLDEEVDENDVDNIKRWLNVDDEDYSYPPAYREGFEKYINQLRLRSILKKCRNEADGILREKLDNALQGMDNNTVADLKDVLDLDREARQDGLDFANRHEQQREVENLSEEELAQREVDQLAREEMQLGKDVLDRVPDSEEFRQLYQRALDSLEFNPDMPADSMLCAKYPAMNPHQHYAEVDCAMDESIRRLMGVKSFAEQELANALTSMGQQLSGDPNTNVLAKGIEQYRQLGKTHRIIDRMLQLCGSDPQYAALKGQLTAAKENPPMTPAMQTLNRVISGMNYLVFNTPVRNQRPGDIDNDLNRLLGINSFSEDFGLDRNKNFRYDRGVVTLRLSNFEELLTCIQANRPENWAKSPDRWEPLVPSDQLLNLKGIKADMAAIQENKRVEKGLQPKNMDALDRLTTLYAQHSTGPVVDALYRQLPASVSPLDIVVVDGKSARELLNERIAEQTRLRSGIHQVQRAVRQPDGSVRTTTIDYSTFTDEQWERVKARDMDGRGFTDHEMNLLTRNYRQCEDDREAAMTFVKEVLAGGVMFGKPASLLPVGDDGKIVTGQPVHLQNDKAGYGLGAQRPAALTLWERFAHRVFGAYQDRYDQVQQYQAEQRQQAALRAAAESVPERDRSAQPVRPVQQAQAGQESDLDSSMDSGEPQVRHNIRI